MMLMQYAQMVFPQGKAQSHTAPLVIPPSDTVFREHYQRLRVGSQIQIGILQLAWGFTCGFPFCFAHAFTMPATHGVIDGGFYPKRGKVPLLA